MSNSILKYATDVIQTEARALDDLAARLDERFVSACALIKNCQGKVIVMGMGKSGHIGNKIAATLASTGTPAFTIHPAEAGHGDLGMISPNDVVIVISYSGQSDEIMTLMPVIQRLNTPVIAMTKSINSPIGKLCDIHLDISVKKEACPHNLAPTSSTTVTLALGDALAISILTEKGFSADDFARSHPAGALGRQLLTFVKDIMKTGEDIPITTADTQLLDALLIMSKKTLGMVLIADNNTLLGIFTDGDLRRVLENNADIQNLTIKTVMTKNCKTISADKPAISAVQIMDEFNLNALPVVDENNQIKGAINNHTLMQAKII